MIKSSRPIFFLTHQARMGSGRLRAVQIAQALQAKGYEANVVNECGEIKNAILVYIKGTDEAHLSRAKRNGNLVILDHIDPHQKHMYRTLSEEPPTHQRFLLHQLDPTLLHGIIFVNSKVMQDHHHYGTELVKTCILHPWDSRFGIPSEFDQFSLGMLGHSNQQVTLEELHNIHLARHVLSDDMIDAFKQFSCHLSVRNEDGEGAVERFGVRQQLFQSKSNIKVSTAAACGANIICSRDPGSADALPQDYPFWYDYDIPLEQFVAQVKACYGDPQWRLGLDMMKEVRQRTATGRIVEDYLTFFEQFN